MLASFTVGFGFFGLSVFGTLYLQYVLGWSPTSAGLAMLPATIFAAFTAVVAGRVCARFGPRLPLAAGLVLLAAGMAGFTFSGADANYAQFGWLMPILGIGLGLTTAPTSIAVMGTVASAQTGMASAVLNMLREVSGAAGIAVMGAVLTTRFGVTLRDELPTTSPQDAEALQHSVTAGGGMGLGHTTGIPAAIEHGIDNSFVAGLHLALWVGATALLSAAVLVLLRMKKPHQDIGSASAPDADAQGISR
ncbi:MFS transporter [Streptomyces avermitilis]|uniref:MFS transporter n=1 Tax=Streptomyces avermitilis TaxID=33903 RepID=UPI00380B8E15